MARILISLIIFALALQNTCPFGFAEKTAVAAPHVHHCPLKDHRSSKTGGQDNMGKDSRDINHPFVLVSAPVVDTGRTFDPVGGTYSLGSTGFEDIFADPPCRPPRSYPLFPKGSV